MKKAKVMHRVWWFAEWQAAQAEEWLGDLSEQSWRLEAIGMRYAKFRQSEPERLQYACLPRFYTYEDERAAKDVYKEAGWTYIDYRDKMLVFRAPVGTSQPVDFAMPRLTMLKLERKHYRKEAIGSAVLLIMLLLLTLLSVKVGSFANLLLQHEISLFITALIIIGLPILLTRAIRKYITCRWRIKGLAEAACPDIEKSYKKAIARGRLSAIAHAYFIMAFIATNFLVFPYTSSDLPKPAEHVPLLSIADIEGPGNSDSHEPFDFTVWHGLLFPLQVKHWSLPIRKASLQRQMALIQDYR